MSLSQNPVGQRKLADELAWQEAEWERDEHRDDKRASPQRQMHCFDD
jgi:hypothetical protein